LCADNTTKTFPAGILSSESLSRCDSSSSTAYWHASRVPKPASPRRFDFSTWRTEVQIPDSILWVKPYIQESVSYFLTFKFILMRAV